MSQTPEYAILLVCAPDKKGLTAFLTDMVYRAGGNILDLQQHVDNSEGGFFLRLVWDLNDFQIPRADTESWLNKTIPADMHMRWRLNYSDDRARMAVFATRESHCLYDILSRIHAGEWDVDLSLIISNHACLQSIAESQGILYKIFTIDKANKATQEQAMIRCLDEHRIDFVVLARYMQVLSQSFTEKYRDRIINIHHSFLPAFPGSKPYHSAHLRGVKIIGASSHYVTAELDAGPIIAQDVISVSHLDTVDDFIRKGRDIEKIVLARAISAHLQHKILVSGNRTVVFY